MPDNQKEPQRVEVRKDHNPPRELRRPEHSQDLPED